MPVIRAPLDELTDTSRDAITNIVEADGPFVRDAANKFVRRSYWMHKNDRTFVIVMVNGVGVH
jgi:hypothetical protein